MKLLVMSIIKHSSPLLGTVSFSNYTGSLECGDGLVQKLVWKLWQTRCKRLLCIYIYVMLLKLELQKISLKGGIFGHGSSLHIVCLFSIVFTNLPTLNNAILSVKVINRFPNLFSVAVLRNPVIIISADRRYSYICPTSDL